MRLSPTMLALAATPRPTLDAPPLAVRVSTDDRALIETAARLSGLRAGAWMRTTLIAHAREDVRRAGLAPLASDVPETT